MPLFPQSTSSSSDFIHAHCDGGSRGNPGPSGFGALITDASGRTLAELSEFLGIRTNNFAEYSGLLAVLKWAVDNHHPRLKVVSDSELMVKQIQGKYKVNSPDLKPLWQEARNLILQLDKFEISHALRHKNKEADALANQAMDRGMRRVTDKFVDSPDSPAALGLPPIRPTITRTPHPAGEPRKPAPSIEPRDPASRPTSPTMLRGFTRDGSIHLLGGATLPDGVFVKIIKE
jgi:ribonuclease HI